MMAEAGGAHGGWMPDGPSSWWFVAAWLVIVLLYGLYRSRGEAEQDPFRSSGPGV